MMKIYIPVNQHFCHDLMMYMKLYIIALFILILNLKAHSFEIPTNTGIVIDEVRILKTESIMQIEKTVYQLEKEQHVEFLLFIKKSLQEVSTSEISKHIFDKWEIEKNNTNRGILILVSTDEQRILIHVGKGLENELPSNISKKIAGDVILPYFRAGKIELGLLRGVDTIHKYITDHKFRDDFNKPNTTVEILNSLWELRSYVFIIAFFILIGVIFISIGSVILDFLGIRHSLSPNFFKQRINKKDTDPLLSLTIDQQRENEIAEMKRRDKCKLK